MRTLLFFLAMCTISTAYAGEQWSSGTTAKYNNLVEIGMPATYAKDLIILCKKMAKNPVKCIKLHTMITGAESTLATNCISYNCTGLFDGRKRYKSQQSAIKDWIKRYNRYWYKRRGPNDFYRDDGPPITRYCMGPKGDGVCVNGKKNAWATWRKINF